MGWSPFRKTGLTYHQPAGSVKGYTLVTPIGGDSTILLDMQGCIVYRWRHTLVRAFYARLLDNGRLLVLGTDVKRTPIAPDPNVAPPFNVAIRRIGGNATHLVELDPDGTAVWQYENEAIHHDFVRLPNGNSLMPCFVELPEDVAKAVRGGFRAPQKLGPLISDDFIEVDRDGKEVSRLHLWQALDPRRDPICFLENRVEWTHTNSLDVTPEGNVAFSCRVNSRIGILEKGTGKLLWKYGAPDITHQHHASVLPNGNIQVFDNGMHRRGMPRSAVVEINPKDDTQVWTYTANPDVQFLSAHISGAERMAGGNVLVCEGASGRVFEITRGGEIVWEWVSPFAARNPVTGANNAWLFRAHRYGVDFPGLAGLDLDAGRYRELNRMHGLVE